MKYIEVQLEKHHILIAEDENDIMEFLIDLLEEDFEITSVPDVPAGLEKIEQQEFDIVITDLRMPGGSGLDILSRAKQKSKDTEVIIITGYGTLETVTEAMKLGISSYLLKPFSTQEFFGQVIRASSSRKIAQRSMQIIDVIPEEHKELREYARLLKHMQDYLLNISTTIDHEEIIFLLLKEVCEKAEVNDSYLIIKNESTLALYTYGLDADIPEDESKKVIEKASEIWKEQPHFEKERFIYPTVIPGRNHLLSIDSSLMEVKFDFTISIPIMLRGQVYGVVFFSLESFHELSASNSQYFHLISKMSSQALDNAFFHLKTKKMAHQDGLTGLHNHQSFQRILTEKMEKAKKGKSEVSLILIDIDNFKKINDTYGHQIGDDVLKILGKILKDDTRKGDEPARYGGEEFAVILPDTPIDQGVLVSERIREHVEKETFHDKENRPFNVTISLGISSFIHSENKTEKALISESDQALYKAKSSGKNQTIIFKDSN
mgnify:CR=1 FL=1